MENQEWAVRNDLREGKKELGGKKKKNLAKGKWLARKACGDLMNFNATRKLS